MFLISNGLNIIMKVSYNLLQTYFDTKLPSPEEVEEKLTFHSFEIEGVERVDDDFIIDIDVLPNRAHDSLSHLGIAKELSVILDVPIKSDIFRNKTKKIGKELTESKRLVLNIEDKANVRRHIVALITNVKIKESPKWLRTYLEALGQRSINNVVDATNYVMLSIGQPTHAFDADKLEEKDGTVGIDIRHAKRGEKITLLGGEDEYELDEDMLVLSDIHNCKALDVAGVKGGVVAELDNDTTSIVVSAANFDQTNIRKTSQKLKLRTDASTRFENGLSPEIAYYGLTELVTLIQELAGGVVEGYVDVYPKKTTMQYKIGISLDEVNKLLGTNINNKEVEDILKRFKFSYEKVKPLDKVLTLAPTFKGVPYIAVGEIRYDNCKRFSCSSLINYLFVQGGVALPSISIDQYIYGTPVKREDLEPGDVIFSNTKNGNVRYESVNYLKGTKVPEGVDHCGLYVGEGRVIHATRYSGEVVEEELVSSNQFKNVVGYRRMTDNNEHYVVEIPFERLDLRIKEDLIEEVGRVYGYSNVGEEIPKKDKETRVNKRYYYAERIRDFLTKEGFTEVYTYSLRDKGELELENPFASDKNFVRSTLQEGVEESIILNEKNISVLGVSDIKIFEIGNVFKEGKEYMSVCLGVSKQEEEYDYLVKSLFDELKISTVGQWNKRTYEFNLDNILDLLSEPEGYDVRPDNISLSYKPFSLFPVVLRDIAVWVPEDISGDDALSMVLKEAGELLIQSSIFDEYKKDNRVSYAFKLVFQSQKKTLSDEEVNKIMKKITNFLNNQTDFKVR
ncbi:MAG TPA: hypothetical protein ENI63_02135 [Candidatus Kaiserbacteria bacterium]|nr:hypothetical protein [Candidatus Kaiserbacteria bacterium]